MDSSLSYIQSQILKELIFLKDLNLRKQRWMDFFASYDFDISYMLGKGNVVADALSKQHAVLSPSFLEWRHLEYISTFYF